MDEKKRLLKNTGIIAIGNMSTKLVSFFLLPLYTSLMSKGEYGTVDYIVSISVFLVPCISLLMDESMFRFLIDCKNDKERSKVISMSLIIILVGCLVFFAVAVPVLMLLKYPYALFVVLYVVTSVLSTMISALLRGIGRTDKYALYNFLVSSSTIVMNVVFIAVLHLNVKGMLMSTIIAHIIMPVIYIISLKLWRFIEFKNVNKELAKDMIRYSFPLIPNKLSWTIINLSDRIIIKNMIGVDYSGLYAVAYKFPNLMDTVYGFFYQSWKESSARIMYDEDGKAAFYNTTYRYLKNLLFAITVGMIAFMPLAFAIFVKSEFKEAIVYVPILLIGTYFANISGFYGGIFTANKNTKIMGSSTIYAAVINLVVNFILIKPLGLYAAAISTFVANFLVYLYRKAKVKQYVTLQEDHKESAAAIVILAAILVLFYMNNFATTGIGCVGAIVYAVFINRKLLIKFSGRLIKSTVRKRSEKNDN